MMRSYQFSTIEEGSEKAYEGEADKVKEDKMDVNADNTNKGQETVDTRCHRMRSFSLYFWHIIEYM